MNTICENCGMSYVNRTSNLTQKDQEWKIIMQFWNDKKRASAFDTRIVSYNTQ